MHMHAVFLSPVVSLLICFCSCWGGAWCESLHPLPALGIGHILYPAISVAGEMVSRGFVAQTGLELKILVPQLLSLSPALTCISMMPGVIKHLSVCLHLL